jgi:hypothetical protein
MGRHRALLSGTGDPRLRQRYLFDQLVERAALPFVALNPLVADIREIPRQPDRRSVPVLCPNRKPQPMI